MKLEELDTMGSNVVNHAWQNNHSIDFGNAGLIDKENYHVRKTLESWYTAKMVYADNNSKQFPRQYSILLYLSAIFALL